MTPLECLKSLIQIGDRDAPCEVKRLRVRNRLHILHGLSTDLYRYYLVFNKISRCTFVLAYVQIIINVIIKIFTSIIVLTYLCE